MHFIGEFQIASRDSWWYYWHLE